jgi:hypothetical protein
MERFEGESKSRYFARLWLRTNSISRNRNLWLATASCPRPCACQWRFPYSNSCSSSTSRIRPFCSCDFDTLTERPNANNHRLFSIRGNQMSSDRRFSTTRHARGFTIIFLPPGVWSVSHDGLYSAASAVNRDGCSVFSGLGFRCGLRCGLLVGHVRHSLLFGCPVREG